MIEPRLLPRPGWSPDRPECEQRAGNHAAARERADAARDGHEPASHQRGRRRAGRPEHHNLAAGHPLRCAGRRATEAIAGGPVHAQHTAGHRLTGVVAHPAPHVHHPAAHARTCFAAGVAADHHVSGGRARAETVDVVQITFDLEPQRPLPAHIEELTQRGPGGPDPHPDGGDLRL